MSDQIFRKKSLDQINSPDQLTQYIKVTNPALWVLFAAVIILLAGVCVWGVCGTLDTKLTVCAISDGKQVVCYVDEDAIESVQSGMPVEIDKNEYTLTSVSSTPISIDEEFNAYALHVGNLQVGQWVYAVQTDADLEAGVYTAQIIIDRVAPISFIMN